jgi:hypothetical protein
MGAAKRSMDAMLLERMRVETFGDHDVRLGAAILAVSA